MESRLEFPCCIFGGGGKWRFEICTADKDYGNMVVFIGPLMVIWTGFIYRPRPFSAPPF